MEGLPEEIIDLAKDIIDLLNDYDMTPINTLASLMLVVGSVINEFEDPETTTKKFAESLTGRVKDLQ